MIFSQMSFSEVTGISISDNIQQLFDLIKQKSLLNKRRNRFFRSIFGMFFLAALPVAASFDTPAPDPRSQALAWAGVALRGAHMTVNPAAGCLNRGVVFSVAYSRPFGLKELQHSHLSTVGSWNRFSATLGAHRCGYEVYGEDIFYGGLSACVLEKMHFGVLLQYAELSIQNYGRAGTLIADVGGMVEVSPSTSIGFTAKNITGARIGRSREELPRSLQVGVAMTTLPNLRLCVDLFKDVRFSATLRCGAEWQPLTFFGLRAGINTFPFRTAAGLMLQLKSCRFDYGIDNHEVLGLSHQCSLSFSWKWK